MSLFATKISVEDIRVEIPSSIYFVPNNHVPNARGHEVMLAVIW